jgi:hypothetical protein
MDFVYPHEPQLEFFQHFDHLPTGSVIEPSNQPGPSTPARICSVKNCSNQLSVDYNRKMCEVCRGRHRIYASTKRAKRKMEKIAAGMQNAGAIDGQAVFMPPDAPPALAEPLSPLRQRAIKDARAASSSTREIHAQEVCGAGYGAAAVC